MQMKNIRIIMHLTTVPLLTFGISFFLVCLLGSKLICNIIFFSHSSVNKEALTDEWETKVII